MGGRLVGADEEQIDITRWRKDVAAIAAGREHGEALPLCRVAGAVHMDGDVVVERVQRLIHDGREEPCRIETACALLQALLRDHPAAEERAVKVVEHLFARLGLIRQIVEEVRGELHAKRAPINDVGDVPLARPATGRQLAVDEGFALFAHAHNLAHKSGK